MNYVVIIISLLISLLSCSNLPESVEHRFGSCFKEVSSCASFTQGALSPNEVPLYCPSNFNISMTDATMFVYTSQLGCVIETDMVENNACSLPMEEFGQSEIRTRNLSCSSTNEMDCTTLVSYEQPSILSLEQCGLSNLTNDVHFNVDVQYRCFRECQSSVESSVSFNEYWHTLNKSCDAHLKYERGLLVQAILSSDQLFNLLLRLVSDGLDFQREPVDVNIYASELEAAASHEYLDDLCEIHVKPNSYFIIGHAFAYTSYLKAYYPNSSLEERNCKQRLMLQNDNWMEVKMYCEGNISLLYEVSNTRGSNREEKYWIWYETDEPEVKVTFYIPIEVTSNGEARLSCGLCGANFEPAVAVDNTLTTPVMETPPASTIIPNEETNVIMIVSIAVGFILLFLAIISVLLFIQFFVRKKNNPDGSKQIDNADIESVYAEMDENQMADFNEGYKNIDDKDRIYNAYVTISDNPEHGPVQNKTQNDIEIVSEYLSSPDALQTRNDITNEYLSTLSANKKGEHLQNDKTYISVIRESDINIDLRNQYLSLSGVFHDNKSSNPTHEPNMIQNVDAIPSGNMIDIPTEYLSSSNNPNNESSNIDGILPDNKVDISDEYLSASNVIIPENSEMGDISSDNKIDVSDEYLSVSKVTKSENTNVAGDAAFDNKIDVSDEYLSAANVTKTKSSNIDDIPPDNKVHTSDGYLSASEIRMPESSDIGDIPSDNKIDISDEYLSAANVAKTQSSNIDDVPLNNMIDMSGEYLSAANVTKPENSNIDDIPPDNKIHASDEYLSTSKVRIPESSDIGDISPDYKIGISDEYLSASKVIKTKSSNIDDVPLNNIIDISDEYLSAANVIKTESSNIDDIPPDN